jgi:hypothetical protein
MLKTPADSYPKFDLACKVFCVVYTAVWVLYYLYALGCLIAYNDDIVNAAFDRPGYEIEWCDIKPMPYSGSAIAFFSGCGGMVLGSYLERGELR